MGRRSFRRIGYGVEGAQKRKYKSKGKSLGRKDTEQEREKIDGGRLSRTNRRKKKRRKGKDRRDERKSKSIFNNSL